MPPSLRGNVTRDAPFGRPRGGKPALTEDDMRDLLAFLKTLSDGFKPD
jgi:cytochrome c peroxidase